MKIEDQVCSLDLATRLKELGVKQESCWYWTTDREELELTSEWDEHYPEATFAAFTAAEFGEMLPHYIDDVGYVSVPDRLGQGKGWWFNIKDRHAGNARNEADARAEMLIYLIENNLLPSTATPSAAQISPESTR